MRYEKLAVWQRSVDVAVEVYRCMKPCKDYGFKDQICRSAVSIASNIAEGSERAYPKEHKQFLSFAKGSVGELKTQLIIGEKIGYISSSQSKELKNECEAISRILGALIKKINELEG